IGPALSDRTLHLNSTLGSVTDGAITDVNGSTFAYIIASSPGDAVLTATLNLQNACEFARSQPSTVTFAADTNPLRPDLQAPYVDGGIQITPEPITQGVLTTIRAKLVNTNAYPISVEATLGCAQSGIGLT